MTGLQYIQPSRVDTPAQGNLAQARDGKKRANQQLRSLRDQLRREPLGGNRSGIRLAILNAQQAVREWQRMERGALQMIEQRANQMGRTTQRQGLPVTSVPATSRK